MMFNLFALAVALIALASRHHWKAQAKNCEYLLGEMARDKVEDMSTKEGSI